MLLPWKYGPKVSCLVLLGYFCVSGTRPKSLAARRSGELLPTKWVSGWRIEPGRNKENRVIEISDDLLAQLKRGITHRQIDSGILCLQKHAHLLERFDSGKR